MKNPSKLCGLVTAMALMSVPGLTLSMDAKSDANLFSSDERLIDYLTHDDVVLSRVVSTCSNAKISRSRKGSPMWFSFTADCDVRTPAEEDLDCPTYRVEARGTVDTPSHATARRTTLQLVCGGN